MLMSGIRQASKPACCAYKRGLHANKTTSVTFIIDWFLVGFGLHRWPCCGPCAVAGVVVLSLFDPLRRLPSPVTVSPAAVHFIEQCWQKQACPRRKLNTRTISMILEGFNLNNVKRITSAYWQSTSAVTTCYFSWGCGPSNQASQKTFKHE